MKNILATLGLLALAFNLSAGDASGRVDTRVLSGQVGNVANEFTSLMTPVHVQNLAYTITNQSDGVIFCRTNADVLVVIGLPNPTNFPSRRFEIHSTGANKVNLTNTTYAGSFTDLTAYTNATAGYVFTNNVAVVYSTGTNYLVRLH